MLFRHYQRAKQRLRQSFCPDRSTHRLIAPRGVDHERTSITHRHQLRPPPRTQAVKTTMFSSLHKKLFGPPTPLPPRCPGTGSEHISARRAATDARYTARPLDYFPNPLIPPEELRRVRAEAGVLDEMFAKYKREAACEVGPGEGRRARLRRCEECGCWCCNVSFLSFIPKRAGLLKGWGSKDYQRAVVVSVAMRDDI